MKKRRSILTTLLLAFVSIVFLQEASNAQVQEETLVEEANNVKAVLLQEGEESFASTLLRNHDVLAKLFGKAKEVRKQEKEEKKEEPKKEEKVEEVAPVEDTTVMAEVTEEIVPQPLPVYEAGDVEAVVRGVAAQYGWDNGENWAALSFIIMCESGWNPMAQNPYSSAFGLFQMLVETSPDVLTQATNGLSYIANRYGTPLGAQGFWLANGWY